MDTRGFIDDTNSSHAPMLETCLTSFSTSVTSTFETPPKKSVMRVSERLYGKRSVRRPGCDLILAGSNMSNCFFARQSQVVKIEIKRGGTYEFLESRLRIRFLFLKILQDVMSEAIDHSDSDVCVIMMLRCGNLIRPAWPSPTTNDTRTHRI